MKLPRVNQDGVPLRRHTLQKVYAEMLRQICADYSSLPDPRSLTMAEIRFFYDGLRPTLKKYTT